MAATITLMTCIQLFAIEERHTISILVIVQYTRSLSNQFLARKIQDISNTRLILRVTTIVVPGKINMYLNIYLQQFFAQFYLTHYLLLVNIK